MVIKRIGVLSLAKFTGVMGIAAGVAYGLLITLASILASAMSTASTGGEMAMIGGLMLLTSPIFFGIGGFISGAIAAVLYNFFARYIGGLEVEVDMSDPNSNPFSTDTPA